MMNEIVPSLKAGVRTLARAAICRAYTAADATGLARRPISTPVSFVIEPENWAIRWVGTYVRDGIEVLHPGTVSLSLAPARLHRQVVHFGSQYMWEVWGPYMSRSNRFVTSFFHGKPEDGPQVARHIDALLASVPKLSKLVVSSSLAQRRLHGWGVDPTKTVQIPIGCDTKLFRPPTPGERRAMRERLGVPEGAVCIGSFQKDGQGWGEGMEPKLIKGPDVFVDVVTRLAKDMPVFVLLTGPARGYVKRGLEQAGIPYAHAFLDDYEEVAAYYHALDLYLVTSREEGGPMALMESMASHVPVVSTRVGQAQDLIEDGVTGGLVEVDDIAGLVDKAVRLLGEDEGAAATRNTRARARVVEGFDWQRVAEQHYELVYRDLIAELS